MSDEPQMAYITRDEFDDTIGDLRATLNTVKTSVDQLNTRLEREESVRRRAVDEVDRKIDERFITVDDKLDQLMSGISQVTGTIQSWVSIQQSFTDTVESMRDEQARQSTAAVEIKMHHNELVQRTNQLHKTIHGKAGEDGPDSIFLMLSGVRHDLAAGFSQQSGDIQTVKELAQHNASLIGALNAERQRWAQRWRMLGDLIINLAGNRTIWLTVIVVIVVATASTTDPALHQNLIEIIQALSLVN